MKTKKLLKFVVAFIVALSVLLPFAFNAVNAANSTATINATTLNVREKPSTSSKKLGSLKKGIKVTVHNKLKSGWSMITYKKKKGYVSSTYLAFESDNKTWNGKYSHASSGTGIGSDLIISKQTARSFDFIISEYERIEVNGSRLYKMRNLKGVAKLTNGKGYYSKGGCNIEFEYVNKNKLYTNVSGSCTVGYSGDESNNSPDEKMGYIR